MNKIRTFTCLAVFAGACNTQRNSRCEWHGAGACSTWMNDYDTDARKNGITDGHVTLSKARHIDITGDRAYVVIPANYTYKKKGKPVKEIGSMLTIALQKVGAGWRITAWSWAKH